MKKIVISGVNLFEGGPLSVYKDCLDSIIELGMHKKNSITIFVNKRDLFIDYMDKFEIIELPKSTSFVELYPPATTISPSDVISIAFI